MPKLEAGAKAPAFTLPDADGKKVSLSSFAGRKVVIYFYPRDDTPGLHQGGVPVQRRPLAVRGARDPGHRHLPGQAGDARAKFRDKYGLQFPLLSDPEHTVMEKYGAWGEKTMYGKATTGVIRSTFLVDEKGKIARAWYSVKADGHAAKVLAEL